MIYGVVKKMAESKLVLRGYQTRIVESALKCNTIALLPTGSGKTLIAAELIRQIGTPSVFFVPTIPLVNQQATAIRSHLSKLAIGQFNGESSLPKKFDVLVTTPKAFESAQARGITSLSWQRFNAVIFDEVHHAIKDHPYRHLALKLNQSGASPRVVGLTASLTYSVGDKKINKSVGRLCSELRIEKIETASDEELNSCGYSGAGRGTLAEVRMPDVKLSSNIVPPKDRSLI
jgi:ERCC4-related helicase